jgi:hypothetical protein
MDQVDLSVQLFGDLDPVLDVVAGPALFVSAHAELNGKVRAHRPADGIHHRVGEPHAVLKAAAPPILPGIRGRGHELRQEPAVAAVDGDHAEAAVFGKRGGTAKGFDDFQDHFFRHLIDGLPPGLTPATARRYARTVLQKRRGFNLPPTFSSTWENFPPWESSADATAPWREIAVATAVRDGRMSGSSIWICMVWDCPVLVWTIQSPTPTEAAPPWAFRS